MNSKEMLGTYSAPASHEQQGGAGDLPRFPMDSKEVLGTYSTPGPHE